MLTEEYRLLCLIVLPCFGGDCLSRGSGFRVCWVRRSRIGQRL